MRDRIIRFLLVYLGGFGLLALYLLLHSGCATPMTECRQLCQNQRVEIYKDDVRTCQCHNNNNSEDE